MAATCGIWRQFCKESTKAINVWKADLRNYHIKGSLAYVLFQDCLCCADSSGNSLPLEDKVQRTFFLRESRKSPLNQSGVPVLTRCMSP